MRHPNCLTTGLVAVALAACGPTRLPTDELNTDLPWPDGLAPMVANVAGFPAATTDEPYPEQLVTVFADVEGVAAVHGRGFLHAPLESVRAALKLPDVVVDRRRVTSWTVEESPKPAFPLSFRVTNTVVDLVTFDFRADWWMAPVPAGASTPEAEVLRSSLVEPNDYMQVIEVSVVAKRISDDVTGVEFQRHTKTLAIGEREAQIALEDLFASLRASVRGEPLPTY